MNRDLEDPSAGVKPSLFKIFNIKHGGEEGKSNREGPTNILGEEVKKQVYSEGITLERTNKINF